MKCPFCNDLDTRVLDSRDSEDAIATRRRRECPKCEKRFTTYERIEYTSLMVVKKDGKREEFSRDKLKSGLTKACQKRPVSAEQIGQMANSIEQEIRAGGEEEIPSTKIGELVMAKLKTIDKVAYIRFASVYKEFGDVKEFEREARKVA